MRDLDDRIVAAALERGLVSKADVARIERLVEASAASPPRQYAAQLLVRERLLSCHDLLAIQDELAARIYACPHCGHRHAKDDLPGKAKKRFACAGCGRPIKQADTVPELSRIEVLASRDPLDLSVPLAASEVSNSLASDLVELDLNRYEVEDELGRGGYGVVFRAHQKDLDRTVALKVLKSGPELAPTTIDRFVREGRAVSKLEHPNIVRVYDIGKQRDLFVMAMEYVAGPVLREWVRERGGMLPWREACELMRGVLRGVEHAHAAGIIHRDLKTTNILVEQPGARPKLIDFGLAKDLGSNVALTQAHAVVGTPNYLAPEQLEGGSAKCDARADVFALGVILYELIAGRRPFEAKQKAEVYRKILTEEPKPLRELAPDVPPAIAEVVHAALEKKPERRTQSAAAMREAIEAVLGPAQTADAGDGEGSSETTGGRRGSGTRKRTTTRGARRPKTGAVATVDADDQDGAGAAASGPVVAPTPSRRPAASRGPQPALLALGGVGAALVLGLGVLVGRGGGASAPAAAGDRPPPAATDTVSPATRPTVASSRPSTPPPARTEDRPTAGSVRPDDRPQATTPAPGDPSPTSTRPEVPAEDDPRPSTPDDPPAPDPAEPPPVAPADGAGEPPAAEPAAEPAPTPAADAGPGLDRGDGDAREFPTLADRNAKTWTDRAFLLNDLADDPPSPRVVRALRFGLHDRFPLNRAFALRGLRRAPAELLTSVGSQALFDALVEQLSAREEYVARTAQELLQRMAGPGEAARAPAAWRRWWTEAGEALLLEAARRGPPPAATDAGDLTADPVTGERLATRTREATTYFSELRDRGLEIVFLIDVTKSMDDELARVRAQIGEITSFMDLLLEKKVRMGFLTYGDDVVEREPLTARLPQFARRVQQLSIFDDPNDKTIDEGVEKALAAALAPTPPMGWSKRAVRVLLLLGDAPPLRPDEARRLAKEAGDNGWVLNALMVRPPAKYAAKTPKAIFEELAALGRGMCVELDEPETLITRLLVLAFGSKQEANLRRFVAAYREVTRAADGG